MSINTLMYLQIKCASLMMTCYEIKKPQYFSNPFNFHNLSHKTLTYSNGNTSIVNQQKIIFFDKLVLHFISLYYII